jgi:Ca2+-binding RTX toxin-like protein
MVKGSYDDFFEALRQRESGGDYTIVNTFGFLGAYQFGEAALVDLGFVSNDGSPFDNVFTGTFTGKFDVYSVDDFLNSNEAQDDAAAEWFAMLWGRIRYNDLEFYDGQTLNGVLLTKSGMIAGAHLLGVGGLRDFIHAGGVVAGADGFGTSIVEYINLLGNYETPTAFLNNLEKDNQIFGGTGEDVLLGKDGDDTLHGGEAQDELLGDAGNDQLFGGDGGDYLDGGTGDNGLFGGAGSDMFIAGLGNDMVETGAGNDVIQLASLAHSVRISDFEQDADLVDMSQLPSTVFLLDGRGATYTELSEAMVFVQFGDDTHVFLEPNFRKPPSAEYFSNEEAFLIFENTVAAELSVAEDFLWS